MRNSKFYLVSILIFLSLLILFVPSISGNELDLNNVDDEIVAGESFIGPNGSTWTDTTVNDSTMNACIKAFTATSTLTGSIRVNIEPVGARTAGAQWRLADVASVQLLTPHDGAAVGGSTIGFTWRTISGATRHEIEIDRLSGSTWQSFHSATLGNVTSTNVSGFLENSAQYRWRVRAGTASAWQAWTPYRTFTNTRSTTDGIVIELRWTKPNNATTDVDLHFARPGGTFATSPGDCYYGNRTPDWGLSGVTADNPWLDRDDRVGPGPEIITLPSPYETGDYAVKVRHYDGGLPTTASVKIWVRGVLVHNSSKVLTANKQVRHVADISWPDGSVIVRNTVSQETLSGESHTETKEQLESNFEAFDEAESHSVEPVADAEPNRTESYSDNTASAEKAGYSTDWKNHGDTFSNLAPGTYTIEFKDVTGWTKPANITVTVGTSLVTRTGTYTGSTYRLTVRSTNPASGVRIASSSDHGGRTLYRRTIAQGTRVTLTAPLHVGGGANRKTFTRWSGSSTSTNRTITLTMSAKRNVTANYRNNPVTTNYTLTVRSTNPTSGVRIASSTGHGGRTLYRCTIAQGTRVTLTAPLHVSSGANRKTFTRWSGASTSTDRTITLRMNGNHAVTAHYRNNPR